MAGKCYSCRNEIRRNDKTIIHCLICDIRAHPKCININENDVKFLQGNKQVKYVCESCSNINLVQEIKELKDMLKTCIETIQEQKNAINEHSNIIKKLNIPETNIGVGRRPYNEILKKKHSKDIVMVKPVEEQTSKITREEIKNKIDPGELVVGVENIKNIRNGGIIISCNNATSKEKIQQKVQEELGERYVIQDPKYKMPKIIILGTENQFAKQEDTKIIKDIVEQNGFDQDLADNIKIIRKYENKKKHNCSNIILEVYPEIFKNIIERGILNVGWRQCKVDEYHGILRCFKCARYNHIGKECRNDTTCVKCSGNHDEKDCVNDFEKCINCVTAVEKLNINLDYKHKANDKNCPCLLKIIEKDSSKIQYSI